jgi:hypothetical protein
MKKNPGGVYPLADSTIFENEACGRGKETLVGFIRRRQVQKPCD